MRPRCVIGLSKRKEEVTEQDLSSLSSLSMRVSNLRERWVEDGRRLSKGGDADYPDGWTTKKNLVPNYIGSSPKKVEIRSPASQLSTVPTFQMTKTERG